MGRNRGWVGRDWDSGCGQALLNLLDPVGWTGCGAVAAQDRVPDSTCWRATAQVGLAWWRRARLEIDASDRSYKRGRAGSAGRKVARVLATRSSLPC